MLSVDRRRGCGLPQQQLLAGAELGAPVHVGIGDVPDHRVAAGHRMVGQEQHRLAGGRDLQGAADQALAGQLVAPGPRERLALEPQSHAVAVAGHRPGLLDQGLPRLVGEPVPARPGGHQHRHVPGLGVGHGRQVDAGHRERRRADGEHVARRQRLRPEPAQRVRRARARGPVRRRSRPAPRRTSAVRWPVRRARSSAPDRSVSGALWCQDPAHRAPVVTITTSPSARSRRPP